MRKVFLRVSRWWCFAFAYPPKKYVFAVQPNYMTEGQAFVKFATQNLNASKFALLYQNDDAGKKCTGRAGRCEEIRRKFGLLIFFSWYRNRLHFLFNQIKNSGAEAIFLYAPANTSAGANAVKTAKSWVLLENHPAILYAGITAMAGDAAEGVYITGWVDFSNLNDPGVQNSSRSGGSTIQMTTTHLLLCCCWLRSSRNFREALRRAGQYPTRDAIVWALETFNGWNGYVAKDISYGPNERAGKYSLYS